MISSAIWDKSAQENVSKTNKIARARRANEIVSPRAAGRGFGKFTSGDLSQSGQEKFLVKTSRSCRAL